MNTDSFAEIIKNPSRLYQLSYQELKSLVMEYPYCHNLHYLLLQKSRLDRHQDVEKNLHRAATYSIDRNFLFRKLRADELNPSESGAFVISDDILELSDLTQLEEKLEKIPLSEEPEDPRLADLSDEVSGQPPVPAVSTTENEPASIFDLIEEELEDEHADDAPTGDHSIDLDESEDKLFEKEEPEEPAPFYGEKPLINDNPVPEEDGSSGDKQAGLPEKSGDQEGVSEAALVKHGPANKAYLPEASLISELSAIAAIMDTWNIPQQEQTEPMTQVLKFEGADDQLIGDITAVAALPVTIPASTNEDQVGEPIEWTEPRETPPLPPEQAPPPSLLSKAGRKGGSSARTPLDSNVFNGH